MLITRDRRLRLPVVLSVLALAIGAPSAPAQQVQWRSDYGTARREAAEKGRPLLIDFVTESCFLCKKLDATTFRDPAVTSLLNEQFVTLKVDAEQEAALAQALRVQQYPTMVLAGPDGKIIGVLEGYQEAPRLADQ